MTADLQQALLGVGTGVVYALVAIGLQVTYRGSGSLNFAHGGLAMLGAFVHLDLTEKYDWPFVPSALVAISFTTLVNAGFSYVVMRRLREASPLARTIATLGFLLVLLGTAAARWGGQDFAAIEGILPDRFIRWGEYGIGEDRLWMLGIATVLCVVLWAVFRFTRFGLATVAAAENERAAATLGWSGDKLAAVSWGLGGALAGLAGILVVPLTGLQATNTTLLVIPALAVCIVGGFGSFGTALLVGVLLGSSSAAIQLHVSPGVARSFPFLLIVITLLVRGKSIPLRGFIFDRPPELGSGRIRFRYAVPALAVLLAIMVFVADASWRDAFSVSFGVAMLLLSIVVLTGYTGQLSLAQYSIGGLGALVCAQLVVKWDWPFLAAVPAAVVCSIPIGLLFAIPALRTRGVNLAVVTLGMAVATYDVVFTDGELTGGFSGLLVGPQELFGISIDPIAEPLNYSIFGLVMLLLCIAVVGNLRRSAIGRQLIAVRTNERAAAALGISVVGAKLYAFGLSAAIAAAGGIVLAFRNTAITFDGYDAFRSIQLVAYAVIGGVGFVLGPLLGLGFFPGTIGTSISNWLSEHSYIPLAIVAVASVLSVIRAIRSNMTGSGPRRFRPVVTTLILQICVVLFVRWVFQDHEERLALAGGIVLLAVLLKDPDGIAVGNVHAFHRLGARIQQRWRSDSGVVSTVMPTEDHGLAPVIGMRLDVRGLTVRFGGVTAVNDVDFTVEPGQVVGLIGPNGAGKTTVIDAITGFVTTSTGRIELDGRSLENASAAKRARLGLSRSFQSLELFEDLTVGENLLAAGERVTALGHITGLLRPDANVIPVSAEAAVRHFRLGESLDSRVDELSYGDRRLTAIARAVAAAPGVLLLDEPAAGLGDVASLELGLLVKQLAHEAGMAVLVVEHDMGFVMSACDRIVVLEFGVKIAEGTPHEVQNNPAVIAAYLGASAPRVETPETIPSAESVPSPV